MQLIINQIMDIIDSMQKSALIKGGNESEYPG